MHRHTCLFISSIMPLLLTTSALAQDTVEGKVATIKESLLVLCLAGGTETSISASGDLELRSKIKDILTGNLGASVDGKTAFTKKTWEGIIGGISKEMTAIQGEQASEARKCMVDHGFDLISKVLAGH
jgi:hypothetical protein